MIEPEGGLVALEAAQAAVEFCYDQGWSDGLPVVPATRERVDEFIAASGRDADEVIGDMPQVGRSVTVELAAVNAVMAGCRPEYFPVVLAAWEALMLERTTRSGGWQSTSGPSPLLIVNGPVRSELGINSAGGVFGPGFRANATIARTIGLIVRNVFGVRPHELEQAAQGVPGRWSLCLGENEEESPWPPLAGELGVPGNAVVATLLRTCEYVDNRHTSDAVQLLGDFADTIGRSGAWIFKHAMVGVVLCPEHAQRLADAGFSRRDVAEWLAEHSGRTTAQLAAAGKDDVVEGNGVRHPGVGVGGSTFHPTLPPSGAERILIAVAGSRSAGISMVVRLFADWSGAAVPISDTPPDTHELREW